MRSVGWKRWGCNQYSDGNGRLDLNKEQRRNQRNPKRLKVGVIEKDRIPLKSNSISPKCGMLLWKLSTAEKDQLNFFFKSDRPLQRSTHWWSFRIIEANLSDSETSNRESGNRIWHSGYGSTQKQQPSGGELDHFTAKQQRIQKSEQSWRLKIFLDRVVIHCFYVFFCLLNKSRIDEEESSWTCF